MRGCFSLSRDFFYLTTLVGRQGEVGELKMAFLYLCICLSFHSLSAPYLQVGNGEPSLSYDMRNRSDIPRSLCSAAGLVPDRSGWL